MTLVYLVQLNMKRIELALPSFKIALFQVQLPLLLIKYEYEQQLNSYILEQIKLALPAFTIKLFQVQLPQQKINLTFLLGINLQQIANH